METQEKLHWFTGNKINWSLYNLAQTQEKRLFYRLLDELCSIIPETAHENGRPPISVKDLVFSLGLKIYANISARRLSSDLKHAEMIGYVKKAPHYNTLNDFMNCEATYDLLNKLLTISAMPLAHLEDQFSVDSSGWSTYQFDRWIKIRFSKEFEQKRRNFIKGHIAIGTRTHVICVCDITAGYASDIKSAPKLLMSLKDNFKPLEVSLDKGYSSRRLHQLIESLGCLPLIPFKSNANPNAESPEIWRRMYDYFENHKEEFMNKYHRRSNVESVFSMVKIKLGEYLKCKNFISQRNELIMKFICHNIICLINEIFENKIHIDFKNCLERYVEPTEQPIVEVKENVSKKGYKFLVGKDMIV